MKTVQPFIDLGFYIVPLKGTITRRPDGKKEGYQFEGAWKELYLDEPYEPAKGKASKLGAIICGKKSGVVSIDCDNQSTYNLFKALDPKYKFTFVSKGKKAGGASIIYRLPDCWKDLKRFSIKNESMELDFLTDTALQFLPTMANKTKVEFEGETLADLPNLDDPPAAIQTLILNLHILHRKGSAVTTEHGKITIGAVDQHYKYLAPFIGSFLKSGKFSNELFRILTPKDGGFRELEQYQKMSTLHPDNVPEGMGNKYLSSVAGVLVCDSSVSSKMFKEMMHAINGMWSKPMPEEVIDAMIKHELKRDKWVFDKEWKEKIRIVLTDYGTMISIFYDPTTRIYYALDDRLGMSTFDSIDPLPKHLNSVVLGNRRYTTTEIYDYLDKKRTIFTPLEPFGELPPEKDFPLKRHNMFHRPRTYDILLQPEKYEQEFKGQKPDTTIGFFRHLIPDDDTRDYVLRFILTKLQTLKFSEVVLYLLGMTGAGKNLFVDWLAKFTENTAMLTRNEDFKMVIEVDLKNFLSMYNLWVINALFANLDEFGEKTSGTQEDRQVLATLKSYTGKEFVQLRTMHTNPTNARHRCTFILTANENRLSPDLEDRRLVLIDTPTKLEHSIFIKNYDGKSEAIAKMFEEQELFAYYWATEYKQLSDDEYRTPPESEFKRRLIMKHLPPSKLIAATLHKQDLDSLILLFEDYGMLQELADDGVYGGVTKKLLVQLFDAMTDGTAARKSMLDNSLRELSLIPSRVRVRGHVDYMFTISGLKKWSSKHKISDDGLILENESKNEL